jgi:hypothetical protein
MFGFLQRSAVGLIVALGLVLSAMANPLAMADTLRLRNNPQAYTGRVVSMNGGSLKFVADNGVTMRVPRSSVEKLVFSATKPSRFAWLKQFLGLEDTPQAPVTVAKPSVPKPLASSNLTNTPIANTRPSTSSVSGWQPPPPPKAWSPAPPARPKLEASAYTQAGFPLIAKPSPPPNGMPITANNTAFSFKTDGLTGASPSSPSMQVQSYKVIKGAGLANNPIAYPAVGQTGSVVWASFPSSKPTVVVSTLAQVKGATTQLSYAGLYQFVAPYSTKGSVWVRLERPTPSQGELRLVLSGRLTGVTGMPPIGYQLQAVFMDAMGKRLGQGAPAQFSPQNPGTVPFQEAVQYLDGLSGISGQLPVSWLVPAQTKTIELRVVSQTPTPQSGLLGSGPALPPMLESTGTGAMPEPLPLVPIGGGLNNTQLVGYVSQLVLQAR